MFPLALSQILHEHSPTSGVAPSLVIVGLTLTSAQLDILYTSLTQFARGTSDNSMKEVNALRAVLLREMAQRLENSK
jgi:hypothetical protein